MTAMPTDTAARVSRTTSSAKHRRRDVPRVLIVGGGFAGLSAAQALDAEHHDVTLIDPRRDFEFLPNIHELVSAVKRPELLRLPLEHAVLRCGHRFVHDTATGIDPVAQRVTTLRRKRAMGYELLIVAPGSVDATHGVAGVERHAYGFRSAAACLAIGKRLDELAVRRQPARVTVVGGGISGVEALGEMLRRHREHARLHFTLIEANDRLLPATPAALDAHLRRLCAPYQVGFELGTPVKRVRARAVDLVDGRSLPSDLTVWTGGPTAPTLLAQAGLAIPGAWVPVHDSLQSTLYPQVLIAGDAAALPKPLAKQAYHALDMGTHAGRNAERLLASRPPLPFRPLPKPQLVSFGDLSCFLVAGQLVLAGAGLAAGKEAVFELVMAQLDRQAWWRRLPRAAGRSQRAAHALLWPSLSSLSALRRQAQVSILSAP
jgi:NADH dehydrogenase FAD-containing subunit